MESSVLSPCVGICRLNCGDICTGCYRHITEITSWGKLSDEEKYAVLFLVDARRTAADKADAVS